MRVEHLDGHWEIVDVPGAGNCGPYATRADAVEDMRGLARFFRFQNEPGFITTDKRAQQGRQQ